MEHRNSRKSLFGIFATGALAFVLAGCGTPSNTPDLLIQNVQAGGMFAKKDSFEVKRPISQVTAALKDRSSACLHRRLESSYWQNGLRHVHVEVLTPKMAVSKERTRMTVQVNDESPNTVVVGDPPPGGYYQMVVDAYPVGKGTTRVETYSMSAYDGMFTAIKPWVTGASDGCPDLTQ